MAATSGITTIFALSSAPGRAGVAVIRISGPLTRKTIASLAGIVPPPRLATLRTLREPHSREKLDQALVLWFPGPSSFTGEDAAELHTHGSRAVISDVFAALGALGLRMAEPGEFTRRAFENGKLDLTEAEGLADLIDARTSVQRKQALTQASGSLRSRYESWRASLLQAMALVEASLDFTDEADVAADAFATAIPVVQDLARDLDAALRAGRGGEMIREGIQVAIVGAPNVGKSSLLNALAGRDAAIVFDEPGTTRDVVEVAIDIAGFPFVFRDTAGLRDTDSPVEREGIRRSLAAAEVADVVLVVHDAAANAETLEHPSTSRKRESTTAAAGSFLKRINAANGITTGGMAAAVAPLNAGNRSVEVFAEEPTLEHLVIFNKIDLASRTPLAPGALAVSAKTGEGLNGLRVWLTDFAKTSYGVTESAVITRARHRQEIEAAHASLARFLDGAGADQPVELLAEDLREAAAALGRLTGAVDAEDVLGAIFGEFCIGK